MTTRSVTHHTFVIERVFAAAPARVFAAFADVDAKKKWFSGPPEWGPDTHTMDFRVGGRETSVGGPKGGPQSSFAALYQDIIPDERIIYTYEMHLDATRISVSLASIELFPAGKGGTRLVLTEHGAYLDGHDNGSQREHGTRELLEQLARSLEPGK
jgi:uncharacterized protein YndB with AHSA1/START domain